MSNLSNRYVRRLALNSDFAVRGCLHWQGLLRLSEYKIDFLAFSMHVAVLGSAIDPTLKLITSYSLPLSAQICSFS